MSMKETLLTAAVIVPFVIFAEINHYNEVLFATIGFVVAKILFGQGLWKKDE